MAAGDAALSGGYSVRVSLGEPISPFNSFRMLGFADIPRFDPLSLQFPLQPKAAPQSPKTEPVEAKRLARREFLSSNVPLEPANASSGRRDATALHKRHADSATRVAIEPQLARVPEHANESRGGRVAVPQGPQLPLH